MLPQDPTGVLLPTADLCSIIENCAAIDVKRECSAARSSAYISLFHLSSVCTYLELLPIVLVKDGAFL